MKFNLSFIFLIILLTFSSTLSAKISCALLNKLNDPVIKSDSTFWEKYSKLASSGNLNDKTLSELIDLHQGLKSVPINQVTTEISSVTSLKVETTKKAKKEIATLPSKGIRKNFEEFMETMAQNNGILEIRKNPGRWHLEKLKAFKEGNVYSVRLNEGYRVLFRLEGDDLTILQVNAADIHAI